MIGKATITEVRKGTLLNTESINELSLKELGEDYISMGRTEAEWNNGVLYSFDHWLVEKEDRWHLSGKKMEDSLWISASKVKTAEEKDIENIVQLAQTIGSYTIPHAGIAMQILSLFSAEESEGEEDIPSEYYDVLDLDPYAYLMDNKPWKEEKKLEIFFTEILERETVWVSFLGHQKIQSGTGEYESSVFKIKTKDSGSTIWIGQKYGLDPFLIKDISEEDELAYTVILQSIN